MLNQIQRPYLQSKLKTRSGIADLVVEDDEYKAKYTKDDQEKTETFLRHFSSVFTIEPNDEMPNFEKRLYTDELNDIKITDNRIESDADILQLQKYTDNLVKWSETRLLRFHPDKCVSMTISNKRSDPPLNKYYMGSTCLKSSDCEKDIGVYINNKMFYDTHINNMIFKANRVLAVVRNTFDYMDEDVFRLIFKGLIMPRLEYASPVLSPYTVCMTM